MKIEIIATTLKEAVDAEKYGADRIELVSGILEGGLTPSLGLIEQVCNTVKIPVNVMVRPHSKSFVYDEDDFKVILDDIKKITNTNANAIVFGSLNEDRTINFGQLEQVLIAKKNLKITFHRAIDDTDNYMCELKKLVQCDINTILTSGGNPKATDDTKVMNEALEIATANNVILLAGSGLYLHTVKDFVENVPISEIHLGSGIKYDQNNLKEISSEAMKQLIESVK